MKGRHVNYKHDQLISYEILLFNIIQTQLVEEKELGAPVDRTTSRERGGLFGNPSILFLVQL